MKGRKNMATFFNQATLSYSGGVVNSNITSGEILEVLSVTKTAVDSEYSPDSDVTYIVNIVNSGNTAFNGLSLTDDLGAYEFGTELLRPLDYVSDTVTYFVNGVLQTTPLVNEGPPLVISGISVPANGVSTIAYTARANSFASPDVGGSIVNTVTVSGGGISLINDSETVTAAEEPILDITKSVSPSTVTENGHITYTFVIRNVGNREAVATDNVVLTDRFDPVLSNISVTYNGVAISSPDDYTYDESTGLFRTAIGTITVPAAIYAQDVSTGMWTVVPGEAVVTVTGTV
jgi:uncharacterized repeat protein (TIGR01451 family)